MGKSNFRSLQRRTASEICIVFNCNNYNVSFNGDWMHYLPDKYSDTNEMTNDATDANRARVATT